MHHDIKVVLYPDEHRMTVQDRVTVPDGLLQDLRFFLHRGLKPSSTNPGVRIVGQNEKSRSVPVESFKVSLPAGQKAFELEYGGSIHHPLEPYGKEQARGFRQTPGVVSAEGVYLSGSSLWYPTFDQELVTFTLEVELPSGWDAVCQGKRTRHVREEDRTVVQWASAKPHEDIHIVAGPFTEYIQPAGKIDAMVFLRAPDKGLANKYLDATAMYLEMYEKLIGPYPYEKFALVENFWETGYGMASFTLLGPKIIRFPFILHSSYPHEILHNWWGNSVFPDYAAGNWAEGLTAYLSDHLIKETRGSGVAHRQENLQKYADYVSEERDFPLTQFRSRHSTSSEAVGYGKSLMFFHMLRQQLGDELFVQGLQDFYKKNEFQIASFDDICRSFEDVSGKEMEASFDQWLTQPGAPELKVA
jgi:aminopeptidase N